MSRRLSTERQRLLARLDKGDPFWPPQLAIGLTIVLQLTLTERLLPGPRWVVPAIEAALLAVLIIVLPSHASKHDRGRRSFALTVTGVVSLTNSFSLVLLVHFLIAGGQEGGKALIVSGAVLWLTNVLLFAVWYWQMDRGGPVVRHVDPEAMADFLFPQMDMEDHSLFPAGWRPGFGDYLYVSLTNATAFSPTDTMPLTQTAKLVMGIQSISAFATIGLVVARAVNILT